jgi:hypothetical protein
VAAAVGRAVKSGASIHDNAGTGNAPGNARMADSNPLRKIRLQRLALLQASHPCDLPSLNVPNDLYILSQWEDPNIGNLG